MKSYIFELSDICRQFPFKEKIVIIDSHTIGEEINQGLIKEGFSAINLKFKTVNDLARNIVELSYEQPVNLLDSTIGVHFIYSILKKLKEQDILSYFAGMEITPSFSHAMYSTIQTLRLAGYTKDTFNKRVFITSEKAEDLFEILANYEALLTSQGFIDQAGIILNAMNFANADKKNLFILQSNLHLTYLEEQLLLKILPDDVFKLSLSPVMGINPQEWSTFQSIKWGNPTPLSYVAQPEESRSIPDLAIFTAKTEEMEVKQILSQLKTNALPLDESVVFYIEAERYITLFYQLSQKMGIPVTFGDGLPVLFSKPGRLVSGILKWIQTNYSVETFIDILNEGLLLLKDDAPSKSRIARVLRELKIGWSEERYLSQIEMAAEKEEDDRRRTEILWLRDWFAAIFQKLPSFTPIMNEKKTLKGISYIIQNHAATDSVLDEMAKTALMETIEKLLPYTGEALPYYDLFEKAKDLLLTLKINASRPKPGHLHASSFKGGIYNSRPNVFFAGLDIRKFPGNSNEDPLLLDTERIGLGNNLPLLRDKSKENLYTFLLAMAQSTGKVTVSYCHFDINENRVVNPAYVLLQCYRLKTGKTNADLKELKALPAPLIADDFFEEKDFWNEQITSDLSKGLNEEILNYFCNIREGMAAEAARNKGEFSTYDGFAQINGNQFDPRQNQNITMSAGRLETLARCPYAYFLKEILRVKPIEEILFDANKWLDAATRGSLLHRIFEAFYKILTEQNQKPSFSQHKNLILEIAISMIESQKELLSPPNDRVFQREMADILECCRIFLREEEIHSENYLALHFEYSFGLNGKGPARIKLPSGEVKIAGIIDRVDKSFDGSYHIIDYKTGSTYGYENNAIFKGGRQLQHMIYALALEQHLKLDDGAVVESSYYFPTVKGAAQRFTRKQDRTLRTNGINLLEKLTDIIKHGQFTLTDEENECKYCEYKLVCRRHFYEKEALERKQSNHLLKGVRAYD